MLTRASRTTPTPERTMPPSHLTAKRIRRRTQRRRAVASQTTSAMRPPRRRGGRRVPAAGPSSVAGPARPSWPARLPTREDRARGQILGKMACLRNLQSNIARDGGRMTRSSLHSRLRAEILHGIDTWNVFSIARGEELRPFSTCVRRCRTLFDIVEHKWRMAVDPLHERLRRRTKYRFCIELQGAHAGAGGESSIRLVPT